jgi:hypothetical protein
MNWAGHGLTIFGGRLGAETATVKGVKIAENGCHGIVILGTSGVGPGSPFLDWNATTGHTGVMLVPGDMAGGMALEASTRPTGALVMDTAGLVNGLTLSGDVIANNAAAHQVWLRAVSGAPSVVLGSGLDAWIERKNVGIAGAGPSQQWVADDGVTTKYLSAAGKTTVVDADFAHTPGNGTHAVHYDTTAGKAYLSVRANGAWKVMAGPV